MILIIQIDTVILVATYVLLLKIPTSVLIIILYLSLPSTPSLNSFGYSEDVLSIKKDKDILRLLQEYNKAIVWISKTTKYPNCTKPLTLLSKNQSFL